MKLSSVTLPSNRNFGFLFTFITGIFSAYFYFVDLLFLLYFFAPLSVILVSITLINADILLPLNKIWMRFGILLGMIINPIILGIIFFGLITPFAVFTRFFGRDELRIKLIQKESHWIFRNDTVNSDSFKNQF